MDERPTRCQADGCCNLLRPPTPGRAPKWCGQRCRRRELYSGCCAVCGSATNGHNGPGTAAKHCRACASAAHTVWTRERLLADGLRWRDRTGALPNSTHWHATAGPGAGVPLAHRTRGPKRRVRCPWPLSSSVGEVFGSWGAFIRELGGNPRGTKRGVKNGQRASEMRAALDRLKTSDGKPRATSRRDAAHGNAATLTHDVEAPGG